MLISGIIGQESKMQTVNLIYSILSSKGKKVSVFDIKHICDMDTRSMESYFSELSKNKIDYLLLKINLLDITTEILNNINFDVMIYNDKADDLREPNLSKYSAVLKKVFSMLNNKGIAIVNVDNKELIKVLEGSQHQTITYGFNSKASITTSSVGNDMFKDSFMCCLQRTISTRSGMVVEPQEYKVKIASSENSDYNVLAAASFAIVNGVDLNSVNFK